MLLAFAQYVPRPSNDNYQITDLLLLSAKERESRVHCRAMLARFRKWRRGGTIQNGKAARFCMDLEGYLLKRQVQDAILFYRLVKKRRIAAFLYYMQSLPDLGFGNGASR